MSTGQPRQQPLASVCLLETRPRAVEAHRHETAANRALIAHVAGRILEPSPDGSLADPRRDSPMPLVEHEVVQAGVGDVVMPRDHVSIIAERVRPRRAFLDL